MRLHGYETVGTLRLALTSSRVTSSTSSLMKYRTSAKRSGGIGLPAPGAAVGAEEVLGIVFRFAPTRGVYSINLSRQACK